MEKTYIFDAVERFINEAQHNSEYVDVNSAAIYTNKFITDFKEHLINSDCEDYDEDIINRLVRILKAEQFDYDLIDEDGNLYCNDFLKILKKLYMTYSEKDVIMKIEEGEITLNH